MVGTQRRTGGEIVKMNRVREVRFDEHLRAVTLRATDLRADADAAPETRATRATSAAASTASCTSVAFRRNVANSTSCRVEYVSSSRFSPHRRPYAFYPPARVLGELDS